MPAFVGARPDQEAMGRAIGNQITEFTKKLAEEDRVICEAVQRGIQSVSPERQMRFSDGKSVRRFQEHYRYAMGESVD